MPFQQPSTTAATALTLPNLMPLAESAKELLFRIREYEAFAAPEDHCLTIEAHTLLSFAAFAALEVEQQLQRLGFGPDYPFAGEADTPGLITSGPWPSGVFVAIGTLRRFLHETRSGTPGYAERAGGDWAPLALGARLGEKVLPNFSRWLDRLEHAVALLEKLQPEAQVGTIPTSP